MELGEIKFEHEQYAEALPLFEAAVQMSPDVWAMYFSVADWYIVQFMTGERALDLIDYGMEVLMPSKGEPDRNALYIAQCRVGSFKH